MSIHLMQFRKLYDVQYISYYAESGPPFSLVLPMLHTHRVFLCVEF